MLLQALRELLLDDRAAWRLLQKGQNELLTAVWASTC